MNKIVIIILGFFFNLGLNAQQVSQNEMEKIQKMFEKEFRISEKPASIFPIMQNNDTLGMVINYNHAFVLISTKKQLPPIKAYSLKNNFPKNPDNNSEVDFKDIITDDYVNFLANTSKTKYSEANKESWKYWLSGNMVLSPKIDYGPWLKSVYGQVNCKDENGKYINVTNLSTPNHYAVGCVALVFTELLRYYNWPRIGIGSHSYTDSYGNSTGNYSVNYESDYYRWTNILDEYYKKASTQAQRNELGKLAFHCAVAVDMDFESNGSTSNVNRIPAAANKYFRFTAEHISKSDPSFWSRVKENIIDGHPVGFSIYTTSGAGHAIVGDGYKKLSATQEFYHLNMGWWGSSNAWYNIQGSFNAGGYTNIPSAVVDMFPVPEMAKPVIDVENKSVTVEWYYPLNANPDAYELMVKEGNNNWISLDTNLTQTKYSYIYSSTEVHIFKVRAKVMNKWNNTGWSNYESIDIKYELNNATPKEFKISPTVVSDILTLEYANLSGCTIGIYDITGKCVLMNTINKNDGSVSKQINLQYLNSGMYFILISGEGIKETAKFMKM